MARARRSSAMNTASRIGTGKPIMIASIVNQVVFQTAVPSSGSASTRAKFAGPTQLLVMKLVCCRLSTSERRIGHQEKNPKHTSIGAKKTSVLRPP